MHMEVVEWSAHGGGRVVSASGSETSVSGSTPASAIIYDAYTSIKKKKKIKKASKEMNTLLKAILKLVSIICFKKFGPSF